MKKVSLIFIFFISFLMSENTYIKQIKVLDKCTYLVEPITYLPFGLKGRIAEDFEQQKAIRVCKKSLKNHPNDPHIKFLLARAYTKGMPTKDAMMFKRMSRESGKFNAELNGLPPQYKKGYFLAKESCEGGDLGGCTLLGYYAYKGLYKKKSNVLKAYLLALWSCKQGDAKACLNISSYVGMGGSSYIPRDLKLNYKYALDACVSKLFPYACSVYANYKDVKDTVLESDREFRLKNINKTFWLKEYKKKYYESLVFDKDIDIYVNYQSCISGNYYECLKLQKFLDQNKTSENKKKLFYAITLSCNNSKGDVCKLLGNLYANLPKNKINNLLAATFFEDGCMSGSERFSCWYAGQYKMYNMIGVTQDIDKGISYMEKSCYLGANRFACRELIYFYHNTKNKSYRDKTKARPLFNYLCNMRDPFEKIAQLGCEEKVESCCEKMSVTERKNKR